MDRIVYSQEKMDIIKNKVQKMLGIVTELEAEFPGRHFTLDGHLVGSVGEVLAAYYYGIELYKASTKVHDGCIGDREVQIKITQQDDIVINEKPQYLLVLYLTKRGRFTRCTMDPERNLGIPQVNGTVIITDTCV